MPKGQPRTREVATHQVIQFLHKAEEFAATAEAALAEARYSPAAGNAVHAGINAVDAILGASIGLRSAGQDHLDAARLVSTIPQIGTQAANHLRRLVPLKTRAEYDPAPVSAADAATACERARALIGLAQSVVERRFGN